MNKGWSKLPLKGSRFVYHHAAYTLQNGIDPAIFRAVRSLYRYHEMHEFQCLKCINESPAYIYVFY